jgi:hypothetical protein
VSKAQLDEIQRIRRSLIIEYLSESRVSGRVSLAVRSLWRARRAERLIGQATKSRRWMPWRQEAMKDVVSCEKFRGAAKQALIRKCPNGETRPGSCPVIPH